MTRNSVLEYAAALRPRYMHASRPEKSAILSEFCQLTGYHRKAAIRVLRRTPAPGTQAVADGHGSTTSHSCRTWLRSGRRVTGSAPSAWGPFLQSSLPPWNAMLSGVDPVRWTPEHLRVNALRRRSTWRHRNHPIHPSFAGKPCG